MKNDLFYIGYLPDPPKPLMRFLRKAVLVLALIVVFSCGLLVFSTNPSHNSSFELGKVTRLNGLLHETPYPMLRIEHEGAYKNVLLLGYGKFGAQRVMEKARQVRPGLELATVTVSGNLIYYNDKLLFQLLTDMPDFVETSNAKTSKSIDVHELGDVVLEGEIVDPKCYFGVMKPGYGKIHRSCGIRCLSGGIPPVLVARNTAGDESYYLLVIHGKKTGENTILSPYVAQNVQIRGTLKQMEDWLILEADLDSVRLKN
ncbi:MAG: hypothetical protein MI784_15530 [Cytophagales bacterium]|nr:hypothetical protein [Cytophagales bacterium]